MKNLVLIFSVFISILTFCTPVRVVSTQQKPDADFSVYRTYNFLDVSSASGQMLDEDSEGVNLLKKAIAEQMRSRGFEQAADPDLWVNIGIVTQQKVQTRQTDFREAPRYIGQRRYSWKSEEVVVNRYTQGTATVDIIDAKKNERLWEGVVEGTLSNNPNKLERRINTGIENLFDKFPVSTKN
jgi:hypothetical protein